MKVGELADKWIEYHHTGDDSLFSAFEKVDVLVSKDSERAWQMILTILKKDSSDTIMSNLAAGPLEDLLAKHGNEIIERVEIKARQDPAFSKLVLGVWRNAISQDVWSRVEILQRQYAKNV